MSNSISVSKARLTSFDILKRCFFSSSWSSKLIDSAVKKDKLSSKDISLTYAICLGVIRNHILCDYYIDRFSRIKTSKMEHDILIILRMSVFQLVFLEKIPAYSVINDAVNLCRYSHKNKACSFVNALLHKISENGVKEPEYAQTADYFHVRYSEPKWLCDELIRDYGYSFAEQFFAECNKKADITLQVNTNKISCSEYSEQLINSNIVITETDNQRFIKVNEADISDYPGYGEGLFFVQDNSAAALSSVCGELKNTKVLDLCSAPGGKSFSCALRMGNTGSVLSCDINPGRLALVASGAERLGLDIISTRVMDASVLCTELTDSFDLVIADAPCSGIGVIRRKPEIRLKTKDEIDGLPELQYKILCNAAKYVKTGGTLIYSTCTVLKAENENVVARFLENNTNFRTSDFETGAGHSAEGCYTFWPHIDNSDGFFICKLVRNN